MDGDKAYILGRVVCSELGINEEVLFCIDTGAGGTALFVDDAIRIGVDIRKLRRCKNYTRGIGGMADGCFLPNAEVKFLSDEGITLIIPFSELPIFLLSESKLKRVIAFFRTRFLRKKRRRLVLPSLLGFDFLYACSISFCEKKAHLDLKQ